MRRASRFAVGAVSLIVTLGLESPAWPQAPTKAAGVPWSPPRTPWGHPDLQGTYTNSDEANTPLERPEEFAGRSIGDLSTADLSKLAEERLTLAARRAAAAGGAETGAGPVHWYEHLKGAGSRPWLIVDPPDGKLPPFTAQAAAREAAIAALNADRNGEGRADSWEDRSMWDRCITRGLPGSMLPTIYGNTYQIVQAPDYVAIRYEMVHETRIIPLDNRTHLGPAIRQYLGDARGRWDGDTLVVETTNFNGRSHVGYNNRYVSPRLRLVERFTPVARGTLRWVVTIDDPETWTKPWTFEMPLTRDDAHPLFEYACHEGNHGLEHILTAARAEERR